MQSTIKKIVLSAVILIFLLSILLVYTLSVFNSNLQLEQPIMVTIKNNSSIDQSITTLNGEGLIKPNWLFSFSAKVYSYLSGRFIYAGSYKFSNKNSNLDVMKAIFSGKQIYTVKVTYPEGISLKKIAEISHKKIGLDIDEFHRIANSQSILKKHKITSKILEGYLMPETYFFYWNEKPSKVIEVLLNQQNKFWTKENLNQASNLGYSKHQILTLASIIEAETPRENEKSKISGVYHNRLQKNWKLEADPTVQYAIGKKKRLKYSDLRSNSPYNTYKHTGLPPGPINSPGKNAIQAALYPQEHNFMYFVARGDGSGLHNFSSTYKGHLKNKAEYKRNIKKN